MAILFALGLLMFIGSIILIWYICIINKFKRLEIKIDESFSGIDIALVKRHEVLTKMIEVVKGYSKHESNTLKEVIELRSGVYDDLSDNEKVKTNNKINKSLSRIFALAENYPELKANENFLKLSSELTDIEDEIAQSRKYFNAVVRDYNNIVEVFPNNIIAKLFGYKSKLMFSIDDNERDNVKVEL